MRKSRKSEVAESVERGEGPSVCTIWLTADGLAKYLQVSPRTIYNWVSARRIPSHKIGSVVRFSKDEIDSFIWKNARLPV